MPGIASRNDRRWERNVKGPARRAGTVGRHRESIMPELAA
jgi:hypothetical protein